MGLNQIDVRDIAQGHICTFRHLTLPPFPVFNTLEDGVDGFKKVNIDK